MLAALVACGPAPEGEDRGSDEEAIVAADSGVVESEEEEIEIPPEGSVRLSEIIAGFEISGHTAITEVEFEDGVWEVEFVVGEEVFELEIDPMTGEALSEEPKTPDDD
jgi:hypothetical protein